MMELRFGTRLRPFLAAGALTVIALGSCSDEESEPGDGTDGGEGGSSNGGSAGTRGGTTGEAGGGGQSTQGGSAGDGSTTGGTAGAAGGSAGEPGASGAGPGGEGGSAGDGTTGPCDPASPAGTQGCPAGEKCTWLKTSETTGLLGCVPSGSVPAAGLCEDSGTALSGATYDDCEAGLVCVAGTCADVCDFDGGAGANCGSGQACVRVESLFADGTERPTIGACLATCDPLTQTRIVSGSPTTCGVNRGCYLLPSLVDTTATCAPAGTPGHNQPITGMVYANSCAPGHIARRTQSGSSTFECTALCKAADVYSGVNDGVAGPSYEGGDPRSPNWLNLPATCESVAGASVRPEVPVTGESCRYYWGAESKDFLTSFSNSIGWCVPHARYRYDPTGGSNATTPWPRCTTLTTGDIVPPLNGQSDTFDWACTARQEPASLAFGNRSEPIPTPTGVYLDRIHQNP